MGGFVKELLKAVSKNKRGLVSIATAAGPWTPGTTIRSPHITPPE